MVTSDGVDICKSLYSFLIANERVGEIGTTKLLTCGLIYEDDNGKYQLVHERKHLLGALMEAAKINHALFVTYDIGAAEELLFSHY